MISNYFVCTLGQAATLRGQKPYQTIDEFLTYQARHYGNLPAVGFPLTSEDIDSWNHRILTFQDVENGARAIAHRLSQSLGDAIRKSQTIAMLCHSSPEFLFAWLGLIKLGHSVLLLAPQCQPSAIVHLCKSCNVSILLHDDSHSEQADASAKLFKQQESRGIRAERLPFPPNENIFHIDQERHDNSIASQVKSELAVAYLHHTSGTSSGLPKPIPQTHRAAIGVLPFLPEERSKACFTTTPLYHGGIADVFRAWTSNALIWLFPSKDVPITARNICRCLDLAHESSIAGGYPPVRYFSSVPYVLQMMEADRRGLESLQNFEIVGVGGAALPTEVGNRLVNRHVNLISRFGSAECGFILSSYRDFASDRDWQYLRNANPSELLRFEEREDSLAELVIRPGWPHMAKVNRDDGSFTTADLFAPHPTIPDAWLYHSRADSQLTLTTGKKFDPAPLESAIATAPQLEDVLIFGEHRAFPGALLFRSEQSQDISDDELLQVIKPNVRSLNDDSQAHAQIPLTMLVPMPYHPEGLEKSSKGTILRKAVVAKFKEQIERAYDKEEAVEEISINDEEVSGHVTNLIQTIVSKHTPLSDDVDLFSWGVDSVACMQLRNRLRQLLPRNDADLPLSVVEDCGTVRRLSDYVVHRRHGATGGFIQDEQQFMMDLVQQFGSFDATPHTSMDSGPGQVKSTRSGEVVVLTGATGALGAHVLDLLRRDANVASIFCLVRGTDEHAAKERVSKALGQRGLQDLSSSTGSNCKVKILQAQLGENRLGLEQNVYEQLVQEVDLIIHVAWTVNFRLRLQSFVKDNIAGVRNLIDLATERSHGLSPRFVYCSSTAAVINADPTQYDRIPERVLRDQSVASPLGYSQSKWVAEQICENANCGTSLRGRTAVARIGQLAGDSTTGIWNTKEAWPMMLSTMKLTGSLPDLHGELLDWLPVDTAAQALLEAAQDHGDGVRGMKVYHVLNDHRKPTWNEMLQWLKKVETFDIIPPDQWVQRLEACQHTTHPALKLLGLWKEAYCNGMQHKTPPPRFSLQDSKEQLPAMREISPLSEAYMLKVWDWVQKHIH